MAIRSRRGVAALLAAASFFTIAGAAPSAPIAQAALRAGVPLPRPALDQSTLVPKATLGPVAALRTAAGVAPLPVPSLAAVKAPALPISTAAALPISQPTRLDSAATGDYTGILIDARQLPEIMRSPAPLILGPDPDETVLYPDKSHVPTPDEVQDESVVRYYHDLDSAEKGVGGSNPLILVGVAVKGYAHDSVQLSAEDMARLRGLDAKLHFSQTWKVGFLIPEDR